MTRLDGKVVLVTGGASGIGLGIAEAFARAGARVAIADIDRSGAEAASREIRSATHEALGLEMDVTDESSVHSGVDRAIHELGGMDVLVSNAGIQMVKGVDELSLREWKRVLAVHLDGAFLTTRACLKYMYAHGGGTILYTGSVYSKTAALLKAPYVTAKHGLVGLAQVVAKEGARHGVRTAVLCPGFVHTPLVEKQIPEQARTLGISEQDVVKNVMLGGTIDGEFTTPQEIAEVALFLAAYPTAALSGQSIVIGHGFVMQ